MPQDRSVPGEAARARWGGLFRRTIFRDDLAFVAAAGVALRIAVFCFLGPLNNDGDGHLDYIRTVATRGVLPHSGWGSQSYQPPLYYLLASPLWADGDPKRVQLLSLALSVATLLTYYRLLSRTRLVRDTRGRFWGLALVALLPQFVMFGLYVSNDALAMLIGALIALVASESADRLTPCKALTLPAIVGLGMLTKATFLAYVPPVLAYVALTLRCAGVSALRTSAYMAASLGLVLAIGGYKHVQNYVQYGRPFLSNLDFDPAWAAGQKGTYRGLDSFLDLGVHKLVRQPGFSEATRHSYPLMLYGTFWYQYIPESNFRGCRSATLRPLGSLIYLLGLAPTALTACGLILCFRDACRGRGDPAAVAGILAIALLLANLGLLLAAELRYDVWSIMQARLLFPSIFGFVVPLTRGLEWAARWPPARAASTAALGTLHLLFLAYFECEFFGQLAGYPG